MLGRKGADLLPSLNNMALLLYYLLIKILAPISLQMPWTLRETNQNMAHFGLFDLLSLFGSIKILADIISTAYPASDLGVYIGKVVCIRIIKQFNPSPVCVSNSCKMDFF